VDPKNQDTLPTVTLDNVEVFSVGTWNGDPYSEHDLDQMVSAFHELRSSWEPAAKAGHEDGQEKDGMMSRLFGVPALGYVDQLARKGGKLIARFKDMPRRFAGLVKAGTYKKISSEVYWNYKNPATGKVYPRVLKAVAFLGADVPAVTNLKEIEALFSVKDNGALVAYDDAKNEFRAYEQEYCGEAYVAPMQTRKLDKATVKYSESGKADDTCGKCRYFQGDQCSVVEGTVDYNGTCDLQKPYPSKMASIVRVKSHSIVRQGDKFCVVSKDDPSKVLGCHDTEEDAQKQLAAVEAGKADNGNNDNDGDEMKPPFKKNNSEGHMNEDQINELMKKREDELKLQMFKEFEDRIHKAREEGKEEANKEAEALREDIRKLQLEKRSERIEAWIKSMKEQGKLLPAEESKVRSLRQWIPDEGTDLKFFSVKEGKTQEFTAGPAEIFESLFSNRPSIFRTLSAHEDSEEDQGSVLQDAGAEVDRRAKQFAEKRAKDGVKVAYMEAVKHVLAGNPGLAERYRQQRQ
jgi:hypothetical protein